MARGGKLDINIDYVKLVSSERAALRAVKDMSGGGHTGAMVGGMVATSLVFFPAAPFFLFMHGKDISIPKGTEITAYVNGDMKLDIAKFQPAPADRKPPRANLPLPPRTRLLRSCKWNRIPQAPTSRSTAASSATLPPMCKCRRRSHHHREEDRLQGLGTENESHGGQQHPSERRVGESAQLSRATSLSALHGCRHCRRDPSPCIFARSADNYRFLPPGRFHAVSCPRPAPRRTSVSGRGVCPHLAAGR